MSFDFQTIEIRDLSRNFGRRKAVARVTLTLSAGDIVGLLGPNGAGKSTLLGMLATLVTPSSGQILYGDCAAAAGGAGLRARIGVLAHELHLYPELTAQQNLQFFADLYDLTDSGLVGRALASAGLSERADDPVGSFSRGMRQRLALERTLLHTPRLVLLDEPFTGLDDRAVRIVADRIRGVAAAGAIVVLATHDLDVADGLVSRIAVIRTGRLLHCDVATSGVRQRYRELVEPA